MPINKNPATHEDAQRIFMDAFYNHRDKADELLLGMKHLLDIRLDHLLDIRIVTNKS